jgi:DNA-binding response OmpR family regulator
MTPTKQVLIVEDDPGTMNLLRQIVERAGYEPVLARGGWEALHLLQERGADLVLLDLMMRGMDGWTLLDSVKAEDRFAALPVLIITAKHPVENQQQMEAHAGQFEGYLLKPFEVDELLAKITQLLA